MNNHSTPPALVVIGNGMAGVRLVEELLALAPAAWRITMLGSEPHGCYNRIQLSPVLAGEKGLDAIVTHPPTWYADNGITLHTGVSAMAIDRQKQVVSDDQGREHPYHTLVLATGSHPIVIPVPGHTLPGVVTFRDIKDVAAMLAVAREQRRAVVIGGGLLGLEAAEGLRKQGMAVTVVHLMDTLMERQLDTAAAALLRESLAARGIAFRMPAQTAAILGETRVTGVRFQDGAVVEADLVVMAVGVRPNIDLARAAGLACERGVVVDDHLATSDPRIHAVGECVQHRGQVYGLLAPLYEQGRVLARHLAGVADPGSYEGSTVSTRLKVTGIDLFSAGELQGGEEILFQDRNRQVYKKLIIRNDRIHGAVLVGETMDGPWYLELMREGTDIAPLREHLLLGQPHHLGNAGHGPLDVAALPDAHPVCGCNGVSKGAIVAAIVAKGLTTLDEVKTHTKASASCGSCAGLVEQILAHTLGGDYATPAAKSLCGCTALTSDQVRQALAASNPGSVAGAMSALGWQSPDGCPACRPALNHYLTVFWPGSHQENLADRFINERIHANIQKDGSYSVVPRIWGGLTTPRELRVIADVAERFQIPEVKFTGGQRITLLGVKKQDLPAVWEALGEHGLVSGHAYGKAMRTVKTCVGNTWCRFGTQDSEGMGIALEKLLWNCWTPHKFKMAVSGCPRNCAEATIKDFGVVAVESGWELHVGGNGGIKVRATDLLCRVESAEEVLEYAGAFLQLYRRQACYLERTAPWVERVGIAWLRQELVARPEPRQTLYREFLAAHADQSDPWRERSLGRVAASEFAPLATITSNHGRAA